MKKGGKKEEAPKGPQTKKAGDLTLTLSTEPTPPRDGENLLRLKVTDASGKPVENAKVIFSYTMPMPGMKAVKAPAAFKNGQYEGKAKFGMAGTWEVTVLVTPSGKKKFRRHLRWRQGTTWKEWKGCRECKASSGRVTPPRSIKPT
ncbi:MAG: FixH family protein (plasmid) [Candidatus Manganitrophus sp.]|nr:MAG: FixH family protein [Candidatus Manganitrophus sp.]